jgi:tripartite-type tricarboxylate transporter receptor subunit TctC
MAAGTCASFAPLAFGREDGAASYPDHMVRLINPWTPGGPGEAIARPVAEVLSKAWNQSVVVESRPGANAVVGSAYVAKARPDGYTLLLGQTGPNTISPFLGDGTPYDPVKDFAPITQLTSAPLALAVRADLPIHTIADLIAYGRAHPGKLSFGSVGYGSTTQIAGELLKSMGRFDMLHVPYKGAAPVITDLMGGRISMTFLNIAGILPYVGSAGKLRPIAVTTTKRSSFMPDVPAIAETLPGFDVTSWYSLMAPGGTPAGIVDKIYRDIVAGARTPEFITTLKMAGQELTLSTPQEFAKTLQTESAKWQKLIKDNHITAG